MPVDGRENLWIETFESRQEGGRELTAYDIFDSEGFYQTRLWLDTGQASSSVGRCNGGNRMKKATGPSSNPG